jgi:endonuclease III
MAKRLQTLVELLAKKYETEGRKGELTDLRDPFHVGCWLILGEHSKKNGQQRSYEALRRAKGITPGQLLDILPEKLNSICQQAGPYEDARAKRLYQFADDIEDKCGQNFAKIFEKPVKDARAFLEKELRLSLPFAEYLLMSAGYPLFALDAKIVRAAARLGYTKVKFEKDFEKGYRDVQKNFEPEAVKKNPEWTIRAFGLLHRLGNDLCIAATPRCPSCPLAKECPYPKKHPEVFNVPEPTGYGKVAAAE